MFNQFGEPSVATTSIAFEMGMSPGNLYYHSDKTRLVDFRPQMTEDARHPETDGTTFDFLGFTHVWGRSRNGKRGRGRGAPQTRGGRSAKRLFPAATASSSASSASRRR